MQYRWYLFLLAGSLSVQCGPSVQSISSLVSLPLSGPVRCEGADFVAFRVDSVWACILRSDTLSLRIFVPLFTEGILRPEWLNCSGRIPNPVPNAPIPPGAWANVTCSRTFEEVEYDIPHSPHSYQIWHSTVSTDSIGSRIDLSVFPILTNANFEFQLRIDPESRRIQLKCVAYEI